MSYTKYQDCIEACTYCSAMCYQCANACLDEQDVAKLKNCIRLDMECAAICRSAVDMMMMNGKYADALCHLCADICAACANECQKHAAMGMEHCRVCAEACRLCAEACLEMTSVA